MVEKRFKVLLLYIIFIMIIIISPNAYALDVSNKVEAIPDFGGGTYYGQTPTSPTVAVYNNIGTRYQGKLSVISFYLDSTKWNWSYSRTYTIELYMETNDWDNNFMYPQVYRANTNGDTLGSNLAKSSVTFVSNKKIKFTFKTPDDVMNTYLKFRIYSTNYNTTGITRISNYNFNKVIITENQTSGGGSSGGGTTPTPTPTPSNSTDAIIDSSIQNTEDIINNNNQNTQDIIENANNNFQQATESITGAIDNVFTDKCQNLLNTNNNGTDIQGKFYFDLSNLEIGKTYTLSTNNNVYVYKFATTNNNESGSTVGPETWTNGIKSWTFTYQGHSRLFLNINSRDTNFVTSLSSLSNYEFMLVEGSSSKNYCPFGSIENNKIDELNDKLDGLGKVIEDSQVEGGVGSNFFNGFDSDDNGGISAIVTKPLMIVDNLLSNNGQCANLTLPEFMGVTTAYLPSGCILWDNATTTMINLWNIFVCGLGSYFILKDIFRIIENLKNPDNDKVEVMDL